MKMNKRTLIFRVGAVAFLLALAVIMFFIGRGHSVYFDNKTIEYNGKEYSALNLVVVEAKGNEKQEAYKRERVELSCMGQTLKVKMTVQEKKNGEKKEQTVKFKIPHSWDGLVINVPAYLAGLPEDAWKSEFVSLAIEDAVAVEEVVLDEFGF